MNYRIKIEGSFTTTTKYDCSSLSSTPLPNVLSGTSHFNLNYYYSLIIAPSPVISQGIFMYYVVNNSKCIIE